MFDLLLDQSNSTNSGYDVIIIAVVLAFALSSMIVFTYQYTTDKNQQSKNLMQAIVMISIVAATVMQAIGDSIARGLGMLGALAIIRFRTTLRNPRNITFVFASLAAGIACGVYGFLIALIGTMGFCISAFFLKFSYFGKRKELMGELQLDVNYDNSLQEKIESKLKNLCTSFELIEINNRRIKPRKPKDEAESTEQALPDPSNPEQTLVYNIIVKQKHDSAIITSSMYDLDNVNEVKLRFRKEQDEI
jgi:uncharacterized membrane protein YhiD involved in acid resistance